jgi:tetratricopeptide (TPR) repeat protein
MQEPFFHPPSFEPYRAAIQAKVAGDFSTARAEYRKCLDACEHYPVEPHVLADLRLRLGDIEALEGNRESALKLYADAQDADPKSPLVLIYAASSLANLLADSKLALTRLRQAEQLIASGDWQPTTDDYSESEYRTRIAEARKAILRADNEA